MQIRRYAMLIVGTLFSFNLVHTCEALSVKSGSSTHLVHRNGDHHSEVKYEELELFLHRAEECRSNPDTCADSIDVMENNSKKTQEQIIDEVNETEEEFNNFSHEFKSCETTQTQSSHGKSGTFINMIDDHTTCRKAEELNKEAADACQELVKSKQIIADTKCESKTLTTPVNDLVQVCNPSAQQPLGTWLEGMSSTFKKRYEAWVAADNECEEAKESLANTSRDCDAKKEEFTNKTQQCDQQLGNLEAYACAWANSLTTDCRAYETCYASVLTRYNAAASELPALEAKWNDTWQSAERMKCLASAVDSEGVVDKDKMETCDEVANTTHLAVNVASAPVAATCSQPEIYPGSAKFKQMVYSGLPPGLPVREPTLCLTWKKQPCAAHSSFDGSLVQLQNGDGICGVDHCGQVKCGTTLWAPGRFSFQHNGTDCTGKGTLTYHNLGRGTVVVCRFDPSADSPYLGCYGDPEPSCPNGIPGTSPADANFIVNGIATGRSGTVTLTFAGTTGSPMSYGGQIASVRSTIHLPFRISVDGMVYGFSSAKGDPSWNDRTFKLYNVNSAQGIPLPRGPDDFVKVEGSATRFSTSCPKDFVFSGLEATYDSSKSPPRVFTMVCRRLPKGVTATYLPWTPWGSYICSGGTVIASINVHEDTSSMRYPLIQRDQYSVQCVTLSFAPPVPQTLEVEFIANLN